MEGNNSNNLSKGSINGINSNSNSTLQHSVSQYMANDFVQKSTRYKDLSVLEKQSSASLAKIDDIQLDFSLADSIIESVKQFDVINLKINSKCECGYYLEQMKWKSENKQSECRQCKSKILEPENKNEGYRRCETCKYNLCHKCFHNKVKQNRQKQQGIIKNPKSIVVPQANIAQMSNKLLTLQRQHDHNIIQHHQKHQFVLKFKGILFPEDLLFKRKVGKDPYLGGMQSKGEKKKTSTVIQNNLNTNEFVQNKQQTEKALKNYEIFHKLAKGDATIDQVKASIHGIIGWACKDLSSNNKEIENENVGKSIDVQASNSVSDSDDSDYNLDDQSCNSVSDNDSDDSETIIMLKTPLKKPEVLDQSVKVGIQNDSNNQLDRINEQSQKQQVQSTKNTNLSSLQQIILDLKLPESKHSDSNLKAVMRSPIENLSSMPTSSHF